MNIRIGLVQMPSCGDAMKNCDLICAFAQEAGRKGCAAVCFPEASLTGYFPDACARFAVPADHPAFSRLFAAAKSFQIDLLVGYMENSGGTFYLTHSLLRPDGTRHDYRKTHPGEREAQFFAAGNRLDVFPLSCGIRAGFQLCVETHFPEITQTLSLRGASIVFAPHAVPSQPEKRRRLWQTYIPARAYDNRIYVACCNQWDGVRFHGGCCAADPTGEMIHACYEPGPALSVFDIDPALPESFRRSSGVHRRYYPLHRKPQLYETP